MARYKLTLQNGVFDTIRNIFIPPDTENSQYQEYLEWVGLGNTPDPYIPPELEDIGQVDSAEYTSTGDERDQAISTTFRGLLNGDFVIAQRNTQFVDVAHEQYTLDRWMIEKSGVMTYTISQDSDTPTAIESSHLSTYSLKAECTGISSPVDTTDYIKITQRIEGNMIQPYVEGVSTLSFWVKASVSGTYCVTLTNGTDRTYVVEYTISLADTWERIVLIIPKPTDGGTWNFTTGSGLSISWVVTCGSSYHSVAPHSWETDPNYYGTSGMVQHSETLNATFFLSQVQLNAGTGSTIFVGQPYASELSRCQRYYEKSYDISVPLGTATLDNIERMISLESDTSYIGTSFNFSGEKRIAPTMRYFDDAGTLGRITGWDANDVKTSGITPRDFYFVPSTKRFSISVDVNQPYYTIGFHWDADSEL